MKNDDYVTATEIADGIGVITENGRPHKMLIGAVLKELGILPSARQNETYYYDWERVRKGVYTWFYNAAGTEFPEVLWANGRSHKVRYLPDNKSVAEQGIEVSEEGGEQVGEQIVQTA